MDYSSFGGGFDIMFSVVPVLIALVFIVVVGLIIGKAINDGIQWNNNNNSPILTVAAKIVTKRMKVTNHHHHNSNMASHHSSSTTYYATFEVESGDRMELRVSDTEYGMLVEGDIGKLTFQGTRYKGFERN